jgi:hypothetical protein
LWVRSNVSVRPLLQSVTRAHAHSSTVLWLRTLTLSPLNQSTPLLQVFTSVEDSDLCYREPAAFSESHAPIAAALATYFDACHQSEPALMASILHPSACLYASEEGVLVERDSATFLRDMALRAVSTSPEETAYDKILSISKVSLPPSREVRAKLR